MCATRVTPSKAMKRQLMEALQARVEYIRESKSLSQAEAAKLLGVTQPRLSSLVTGRLQLFSLEALVELATRAGLSVKMTVGRSYRN
jgi:predicted XRE-type DNA-binding protein